MNSGDPIWYRQVMRGGYGYENRVPGVYVRSTPKKVRVRVFTKAGTEVEINVDPDNVTPRNPEEVFTR